MVDWLYRFDQKTPDEWFLSFGLVDLVRGGDQRLERMRNRAFDEFEAPARAAAGSPALDAYPLRAAQGGEARAPPRAGYGVALGAGVHRPSSEEVRVGQVGVSSGTCRGSPV